jgi:maleylacetate reductase
MKDQTTSLRDVFLARGFTVSPSTTRVEFGVDALERLPSLVDDVGGQRVLIIGSAGRAGLVERAAALLAGRLVGVDTRVAMHVPADLADAVRADVAARGVDLILAVGGGSAIGMAKAIALGGGPPSVAVPTTYAGSEMTSIWGLTRAGEKETGRDERVRPRAVLYDPMLTMGLPPRVAGPSALNAVAHCMEALYAPDANPLVALIASEGLRALTASLPRLVRERDDIEGRSMAMYGTWLAGSALGTVTMGLHHKLCHVLGGTFGLAHAETHAIVLPHAIGYNAAAAPAAMRAAAEALGLTSSADDSTDRVPAALHALLLEMATATGAPTSLRELGLREADIGRAAEIAAARPYPNPRPVRVEGVAALLRRAWAGDGPNGSTADVHI